MSHNNYVQLKGRLGGNPEFRKLQNGKDIATFSIAVSDTYFDKDTNEWKNTETEWCRATAFGALEISEASHLMKGKLINATGKLKTSEYRDKDGAFRIGVEVILSSLEEIVCRKKSDHGEGQGAK